MVFYQIQIKKDILPNICSLFKVFHLIEDDKMSYELIEYQEKENNYVQKFPVRMGSLSLTIIFWFTCRFWIVSINKIMIVLALKGWDSTKKCAYLVRLSTSTMMTLFHSHLGKPMIKSIETSSQHYLGMNNVCKITIILIVSILFSWKAKHSTTKFWISYLSPSQKPSFFTLW